MPPGSSVPSVQCNPDEGFLTIVAPSGWGFGVRTQVHRGSSCRTSVSQEDLDRVFCSGSGSSLSYGDGDHCVMKKVDQKKKVRDSSLQGGGGGGSCAFVKQKSRKRGRCRPM